jgi:Caspase domain
MTHTSFNRKVLVPFAVTALLLATQAVCPSWASAKASGLGEASKVHVVLLVCKTDSEIGDADARDVEAMRKAIEQAFYNDSNRVVFHDLTGMNPATNNWYSAEDILGYLRNMQVGPNENVLVYHSGHGAILNPSAPEATQLLVMNGGRLLRKEIMDAVMAHNPRGFIMLTDCCSSYMGEAHEAPDAATLNVETVRCLLLNPTGIVSLTAAEDGRTAVASFVGSNPGCAGSAFTVAFLRLCYRDDVTYMSWESMFPVLRYETGLASGGRHYARAFQIAE